MAVQVLTFTGIATPSGAFVSAGQIQDAVRVVLNANGWSVNSVSASIGFVSSQVSLIIQINGTCPLQMPIEEITQRMQNALNSMWEISAISISFSFSDLNCVIGGSSAVVPAVGNATYTVKSGDTLSKIASAHGMTLAQLLALNPQITNPNLIQVGQVINIAGSGTQPPPKTTTVITGVTPTGQVQTTQIPTPAGTKNDPNKSSWAEFAAKLGMTTATLGILAALAFVMITQPRD